jgi:hypothetical protein
MQTRRKLFTFDGAQAPPAVASRDQIWCSKITKTAGSPTVKSGSDGSMQLALTADAEVQNLCLYMGDLLQYDIDDIIKVRIAAALTAALPAACMAAFGVCAARNDAIDSLAAHASFRVLGGAQTVYAETDDGVNDVDDKSTGMVIGTTFKDFEIDFSSGFQAVGLPGRSKGGKGCVLFKAPDANGRVERVLQNTLFDMSNYSSGLQLYAQLQKTADAAVATLSILEMEIEYKLPTSMK